MNSKIHSLVVTALAIILFSCSGMEMDQRLLVRAAGEPGEIVLVADSTVWQGVVGKALRSTLNVEVPGLGQDEPLFTVRYIKPRQFNSVLNKTKNIIFVATLDSNTKGGQIVRNFMSPNYIQENPDKYVISQKDIYASGQEVLYLFSATEEELALRINENPSLIRNFFLQKEKERMVDNIYAAKERKGVSNKMLEEHDYYLRVPNGYRLEANEPNFIWYRSPGLEIDKNIFVYKTRYTSDEAFSNASVIKLRNVATGTYIFEDPENPASFVVADTVNIRPFYRSFRFNGKYTKEVRGIWRANNLSMGGPFIGYTFVDEDTNVQYYIDGFVIAPGKNKRELLRELDAILSTFKTRSEYEQAQSAAKKVASNQ